jgi:hypothetical protein
MKSRPRARVRSRIAGGGTRPGGSRRTALNDPYKLERRREEREEAQGSLVASYSNGVDRFGITHLELVDRSSHGLGAVTQSRIEPGEIVTICPEGSTIPWVSARAVRCVERDGEYLVGMRYCGAATAA